MRPTRLMNRLWADAEAAYRDRILDILPAAPEARLLDVGCEDGAWTDRLRNKLAIPARHVTALEIEPEKAEVASRRGFDVRVADVEQAWPVEDALFDVVHANQVIEHVKYLDHFVLETKRVLVPGGAAIVCTENLASWHNIAALVAGYQPFSLTSISRSGPIGNRFALHAGEPCRLGGDQHVHVMTLTALLELYAAHGFEIESSWGTGYHPFAGSLAGRLARLDPRHTHFIAIVARAPARR